ncbi:hypothetical protein [Cryobacterium sp. RTS3]|uniref:hypothetical protein n=1 Tax=Cryobacterium sp. RTS3 TaxID=3048643 RepID=UPI002B23C5BB|nr:hypothetical protein [Cryobacterium sp. RTS3]
MTNRTNTRTFIVALVPGNRFLTNAAPYIFSLGGSARTDAFVLGVMSSLVFDWYARCWTELNLNFFIFNSLTLPMPETENDKLMARRLTDLAASLAAVDQRFAEWADSAGVQIGSATTSELQNPIIYEIDALAAHLYGLDRHDLEHIFDTFQRGWDESKPDYIARREGALFYFDAWAAKETVA